MELLKLTHTRKIAGGGTQVPQSSKIGGQNVVLQVMKGGVKLDNAI